MAAGCGRRFSAGASPARRCNLERFLEATTPVVTPSCSSKEGAKGWGQSDADDSLPFFTLGDLWDAFRECSAYGTAVPLVLNGRCESSDGVVQYYVPYLSAIQLYGGFRRHIGPSRTGAEESDSDLEHETSSSTNASAQETSESSSGSEASSDDGEPGSSHEHLLFEFLESESPYQREPLADKICSLTKRFPELQTLRSCDLSPASWISIAWYPIYRIPTAPTQRDLDACFLTYHSLSTQFAGARATPFSSVIISDTACAHSERRAENQSVKKTLPASHTFETRRSFRIHQSGNDRVWLPPLVFWPIVFRRQHEPRSQTDDGDGHRVREGDGGARDGDVAPDVRHGVVQTQGRGVGAGLARPAARSVPRAGRRRVAPAPARGPPGPPLLRCAARAQQEMVIGYLPERSNCSVACKLNNATKNTSMFFFLVQ